MKFKYFNYENCYPLFKKEMDFDITLNWKENYERNKDVIEKWKQYELEFNKDPYVNYIEPIYDFKDNGLTIGFENMIYSSMNMMSYSACFWFIYAYKEYLEQSNLIGMNEHNQLLIVRELHYNDEEGCCYSSDLDDYLIECGWDEASIKKRNDEAYISHCEHYKERRRLLSERLKINTIDEIRNVFKHFIKPEIKDKYSIVGIMDIKFQEDYYPKSIEDLNRVYNDIKNGKLF